MFPQPEKEISVNYKITCSYFHFSNCKPRCMASNDIEGYSAQGKNDLVECPYDPVHKVLRKRLQCHLIKCKQNQDAKLLAAASEQLVVCPYDATHRMAQNQLITHIANCSQRFRRRVGTVPEMRSLPTESSVVTGLYGSTLVNSSAVSCVPENLPFYPDVKLLKPAQKKEVYKALVDRHEKAQCAKSQDDAIVLCSNNAHLKNDLNRPYSCPYEDEDYFNNKKRRILEDVLLRNGREDLEQLGYFRLEDPVTVCSIGTGNTVVPVGLHNGRQRIGFGRGKELVNARLKDDVNGIAYR